MSTTNCFPLILAASALLAFAQSPQFQIAEVHASEPATNPSPKVVPPHNGRYEIHTASMLDLVRIAYGFDQDKILGGPNWLELNRYEVTAQLPAGAEKSVDAETLKAMLQTLLEERFGLVVRRESRTLPTYVLAAGGKSLLRKADGSGYTGCRMATQEGGPAGAPGFVDSDRRQVRLGPDATILFECRNMTMDAFAAGMRSMLGAGNVIGPNAVIDETELQGAWNFDVKWSVPVNVPNAGKPISIVEAVEKQLGLKLVEKPVEQPVLVVASVHSDPTPNASGISAALPRAALPAEFEVADIKLSDPAATGFAFETQPSGRFLMRNMSMSTLLGRAFGITTSDEMSERMANIPNWVNGQAGYDIQATTSPDVAAGLSMSTLAVPLRALLEERFGFRYHVEDRPVNAYTLVAGKVKMNKADPASRSHCLRSTPPPNAPPASILMTCQNATMDLFTGQLRGIALFSFPVFDATGLEGGWDFTLLWSYDLGGRGGDAGAAASDPSGGMTVSEAIEKQLGLKLELQKRPMPVYVIDHLEQKPTEN